MCRAGDVDCDLLQSGPVLSNLCLKDRDILLNLRPEEVRTGPGREKCTPFELTARGKANNIAKESVAK